MAFELRWSPKAKEDLAALPVHRRVAAVDGAERHLVNRPADPTRNRKQLRENPLATWELRLGDLRVFYNINQSDNTVDIVGVGIKDHDRLIVGGEEIQL